MNVKDVLIKGIKKSYHVLFGRTFINPSCDLNRQSANDKIFEILSKEEPCMIARFGSTELITINNYLCIRKEDNYFKKIGHYITDKTHLPWWQKENFKFMDVFSGVFPPTEETMVRFSQRYLNDIPLIDILGSWQYYEKFMPLRSDVKNIHLETLYPFFVDSPWTRVLKGKKVLIVHPFEDTIVSQYSKRNELFNNPDVLPDFELITLKAIQSAAGIKSPYKDWFEALRTMENQISEIDFDICILGCGAYGLPLAAYIKRLGKKSIHFGGGLQLLFGIKGKRWDNPDYLKLYNIPEFYSESYKSLYNNNWTKPLDSDTPKSASKLDGATYW
ncbi:hypothetical protein Q4534_23355 [Cyclobacterium sp. 1_MG-2023]|uniref:hypothetical protein n=1 Tax=Cyclobacterium sp. 1_MG-2023 TaxID=3062681 RepID=UPI0026E12CAD|nr:hypothetical protein [Cyclobacterium sp. 1_MG-2023]MDO6440384.1 hypothetical protein [Cyclobacterium sp. 1_MG-2023]